MYKIVKRRNYSENDNNTINETSKYRNAIGFESSKGVVYGGADLDKKVEAYSNMKYIVNVGYNGRRYY